MSLVYAVLGRGEQYGMPKLVLLRDCSSKHNNNT